MNFQSSWIYHTSHLISHSFQFNIRLTIPSPCSCFFQTLSHFVVIPHTLPFRGYKTHTHTLFVVLPHTPIFYKTHFPFSWLNNTFLLFVVLSYMLRFRGSTTHSNFFLKLQHTQHFYCFITHSPFSLFQQIISICVVLPNSISVDLINTFSLFIVLIHILPIIYSPVFLLVARQGVPVCCVEGVVWMPD